MKDELIKLNCLGCGGPMKIDRQEAQTTCPYCGNVYVVPEILEKAARCPVCGRNDVVYRAAAITKDHFLYAILGLQAETFDLSEGDEDDDAADRTQSLPPLAWLFLLIPVLFLQYLVRRLGQDPSQILLPTLLLLALGMGVILYAGKKMKEAERKKAHKENIEEALMILSQQDYARMRPVYEKLFYCQRDGVVFLPKSGDFAEVKEMKDYIRKHAGRIRPPARDLN